MKDCCAAAVVVLSVLALSTVASAQAPDERQEMRDPPPPSLSVRAFGSVQFGANDRPDVPSSFALGQFSLFATSTLGERASVLAEVVMEGSTNTRVVTDLERLQLTYRFNDLLHVTAGRWHSGIGYYNTAFHHGGYFETVIGRPRVFAFEDEAGVLPVHDVGITVKGIVPKTGSSLHYLAEVGNGRSWNTTPEALEGRDTNDAKATNVGLAYRSQQVPGFEVGSSFYRDAIATGVGRVAHRIAAGYAVYRTPAVELMGEWLRLYHRTPGGLLYTNDGGYLQLSRAWGRLRPYYRYDRLEIDPGTPLIGPVGSYTSHIVGLRFEVGDWAGLKAQYGRADEGRARGVDSFRSELVFVF